MTSTADDAATGVARLAASRDLILAELRRVIVGQSEAIDLILTAVFAGGHCLLTGVPGLAKTRLIR